MNALSIIFALIILCSAAAYSQNKQQKISQKIRIPSQKQTNNGRMNYQKRHMPSW